MLLSLPLLALISLPLIPKPKVASLTKLVSSTVQSTPLFSFEKRIDGVASLLAELSTKALVENQLKSPLIKLGK